MSEPACEFCGRIAPEPLGLGALDAVSCEACAARLGALIQAQPTALASCWPELIDDIGEPEPRVRMPDGSNVELRERSAQLKRELSVAKRMELCELLGQIGLKREQILEAGFVLASTADRALLQQALDVVFGERRAMPGALNVLRAHLLPS